VEFVLRHGCNLLVVIYNLHVVGVTVSPLKANSPTVIDPDAVLPGPIPGQLFESVCRGNAEIIQGVSVVEHPQFP